MVDIRPWAEGDLSLLERLMGDPAMTAHLGGPEQTSAGSVGYWERQAEDQTVWETGWSVLPEFQGMGLATQGTTLAIEQARAEGRHRYMHAYPAVDNPASNAICRKPGFALIEQSDFEYPPGNILRCND